jgi:ferredoxin-nitrite reductase
MSNDSAFTKEQQNYLQGFALGADVARAVRGLPVLSGCASKGSTEVVRLGPPDQHEPVPAGPERFHVEAQNRFLAAGKKLAKEEQAKREKHPFEMWDEMRQNAAEKRFPSGTDVFLFKYHGLFYVAPAQDAFMCRLRFPGGALSSHQLRGLAEIAERLAGGFADITTRANLQLRQIPAEHGPRVLQELLDLGIINRGAGADNIRNVTAGPTSGFDRQELIETLPLAQELHHYILQHRELYGLPRKFNIAFDGGGAIRALEDTNDIGFTAVRVPEENPTADVPAGVYFELGLGGITGHKDFTRETGILLRPNECLPAAAAIVRVFLMHGDRTDRNKARLKYLLDAWGIDRFLDEVQKLLPFPWRKFSKDRLAPRPPEDRFAHVGFHCQKQAGRFYAGVVLPVGRMTVEQMRGLASIADDFGSGALRLTVWQNLLIPDVAEADIPAVQRRLEEIGLDWRATSFRAGLVACTGNTGCKYAASNTKGQAMILAEYLESRIELDQPVNIHLTGCHHSCAQHYIGDIGLLAAGVESGEEMVEGYHLYVGGGWDERRAIGRELFRDLPFPDVPPTVEKVLKAYLENRLAPKESFAKFAARHSVEELRAIVSEPNVGYSLRE